MAPKMKTSLLALLLSLIVYEGQAQKSIFKFGDIPMDIMKMTSYKEDSSAAAVVLTDYGEAFLNTNAAGLSLAFDRHIIIKILKKDGLKWADASIELYKIGSAEERVSNL